MDIPTTDEHVPTATGDMEKKIDGATAAVNGKDDSEGWSPPAPQGGGKLAKAASKWNDKGGKGKSKAPNILERQDSTRMAHRQPHMAQQQYRAEQIRGQKKDQATPTFSHPGRGNLRPRREARAQARVRVHRACYWKMHLWNG